MNTENLYDAQWVMDVCAGMYRQAVAALEQTFGSVEAAPLNLQAVVARAKAGMEGADLVEVMNARTEH